MSTKVRDSLAADLIKGVVAGAAATWVMERVTTYMYEHENRDARRLEDEVRHGKHAFAVAAEKTSKLTGVHLSKEQQEKVGMAYHWGLGLGAGALYAAVRRRVDWVDRGQGLAFGLMFFLLVDEAMNTALGLTPPPQAYPMAGPRPGGSRVISFTAWSRTRRWTPWTGPRRCYRRAGGRPTAGSGCSGPSDAIERGRRTRPTPGPRR